MRNSSPMTKSRHNLGCTPLPRACLPGDIHSIRLRDLNLPQVKKGLDILACYVEGLVRVLVGCGDVPVPRDAGFDGVSLGFGGDGP